MEAKTPMMLKGDATPGFKIDLHIKDLKNVVETGKGLEAALPVTELAYDLLKSLSEEGLGNADHSALVRYFEKKDGVKLS
ncbi:MAG: NAD-binding protein, partial [Deltaproteobacteria bacterium]|jgi:2-hydroxy-3-oxopropionate reductase|nr:NAD-binding protein [Deltaproteobacteria bacterium]